ncbi:Maf family protein [Sporosarcina sp. FSL K6-1522]|uniref:Maf family protein n=1 Tax=Sporosarcina sp. FSL K6-1522 TaxID=2921554 RepID=UPI00315A7449
MKFNIQRSVVLASASPRRKELLSLLGFPFEIVPSHVAEDIELTGDVTKYARELAAKKTLVVAAQHKTSIVIGADTIVVLDGKIYPKPNSNQQAKQFLQELSGKTHSVITGVGIHTDRHLATFAVETKVTFRTLDEVLIDAYVASGDSMDKAGAYGIQTAGALLVEKIEGDYHAVVGLPIAKLAEHLRKLGLISLKEDDPYVAY